MNIKTRLFFSFCAVTVFFLLPATVHATTDSDNDGLSDDKEIIYHTDPTNPDTDGDGFLDGDEVAKGFSPIAGGGVQMYQHDLDGDKLNDWLEVWFHSDMGKKDTDGDGYDDYTEVMEGFDPASIDSFRKFARKLTVDLTTQRLFYTVDGVKIHNYPASTGNPGTVTPNGIFDIYKKIDVKDYKGPGYFVPNVDWNMEFLPGYYVHSAYWHNDFGKKTHSHGCVNLTLADAKELYAYVDVGVPVFVTGTTPSKYRVGT